MIAIAQWTPAKVVARGTVDDWAQLWQRMQASGPVTVGARVQSPLERKLAALMVTPQAGGVYTFTFTPAEWEELRPYLTAGV